MYFPSQIELPETPLLNGPQQVDDGSPPGHLFANSSTPSLPDIAISTREHSFVKTAFDKRMCIFGLFGTDLTPSLLTARTCRVCLLTIKNSAVLCSQCSLISHFKCAVNAPPTCDLRAQLLLYAREAEKGKFRSALFQSHRRPKQHYSSDSSDSSVGRNTSRNPRAQIACPEEKVFQLRCAIALPRLFFTFQFVHIHFVTLPNHPSFLIILHPLRHLLLSTVT